MVLYDVSFFIMTIRINTYLDTRGLCNEPLTFTQAIVKGLAPGGGLFVPHVIPCLTLERIIDLSHLSYAQRAAEIYRLFGVDFDDATIEQLMETAYGSNFDTEKIAPITTVAPGMHVLELWHGPTSAFKDMALQCLPVFFSAAIDQLRIGGEALEDFLILVATSGDTGKAALEGFKDRDHTSIVVFYPDGGVSDIQFKQMATQRGENVGVFGVTGNFDDCQNTVKAAFNDEAWNEVLLDRYNLKLSSANSINWGRLLPQIVYYVSSYSQMVADGTIAPGCTIDVCVPTGNFGNILGAYYAKEMGVPIDRLLCASNENRVLADFINTGVYDIADREFVLTPSPSMDILVSSNLERQLFELTGRDGDAIRGWMQDLKENDCFRVDPQTFAALREHFSADSVDSNESLSTIKEVFDRYHYLIDPHTAVAWRVAERLRQENPVLIVSTAHWAKFGTDVYRALNNLPAGASLPPDVQTLSGVELNAAIAQMTDNGTVPSTLAELDELPLRFGSVCERDVESIEHAVESWITTTGKRHVLKR